MEKIEFKGYLQKLFDIDVLNIKIGDDFKTNIVRVGELKEKSIHHILKNSLGSLDFQEVKIDNYYADLFIDDIVVEIQTKSFSRLRGKLNSFLPKYKTVVVYPVIYINEIKWIDRETGDVTEGVKRTNYSSFNNVFKELYQIKSYLHDDNLNVVILLYQTVEHRYLDGYDKTRKKGATKIDKYPIRIIDKLVLCSNEDYKYFIKDLSNDVFSTKDYKAINRTTLKDAQLAVNILSHVNVIEKVGKQGKMFLYKKVE